MIRYRQVIIIEFFDDFIAVQHMLDSSRRGKPGFLPELRVVTDGALKGFVLIHPLWAAFRAEDYLTASDSVYENNEYVPSSLPEVHADAGEFDLRGFEIARTQFFNTAGKLCLSVSSETVIFSTKCIQKLDDAPHIEMLIHPRAHLLAIRKAGKESRYSIKWAILNSKGKTVPRRFTGKPYLETLYSILGWDPEYRYRICGIRQKKEEESILLFNLRETEVFVPETELLRSMPEETADASGMLSPIIPVSKNSLVAYPETWANDFGKDVYAHAQSLFLHRKDGKGSISGKTVSYAVEELHVTPPDAMYAAVQEIIKNKSQEELNHGTDRTEDAGQ